MTKHKEGRQSTSLFRLLNFELFVKPNKVVISFGLSAITGCVAYLAYLNLTHQRSQDLAASSNIKMPLYNTVLYIPPIEPPRITDFDSSASHINDDRIKIAEVEACFGEFEAQLSKFCHCSQSNDVHTPCCVPGAGNFTHPVNERYLRRTVDEQLRDLTLEGERNRTRVDRDPQNSNFDRNSISILHRRGRFDSHRAQDSVTQSSSGIAEAESSDNFLVDEEEAEATVATEEELDATE